MVYTTTPTSILLQECDNLVIQTHTLSPLYQFPLATHMCLYVGHVCVHSLNMSTACHTCKILVSMQSCLVSGHIYYHSLMQPWHGTQCICNCTFLGMIIILGRELKSQLFVLSQTHTHTVTESPRKAVAS